MSYSISLNKISEIPSKYWCAGKLYVFSNEKQPFLHFDGDVILGDDFNKEIIFKDVIAEYQYEDMPNNYGKALSHIKGVNSSIQITERVKKILNSKEFIYNDYNLGIIGGNNYEAVNKYAKEGLELIYLNADSTISNELPIGFLNCFVDQFIFFNRMKSDGIQVALCIEKIFNSTYDYQGSILKQLTKNFSFVHLHSTYKLNYYDLPEKWLKYYYRDVYDKINLIIFGKTIE